MMEKNSRPVLYTINEAAEILRCSYINVRQLITANKLKAVCISTGNMRKTYRIQQEELDKFIENGGVL